MFNADNLIATYEAPFIMSALPPKADVCTAMAHVRFGPKADIDMHRVWRRAIWLHIAQLAFLLA
jgi:hypothetical protein